MPSEIQRRHKVLLQAIYKKDDKKFYVKRYGELLRTLERKEYIREAMPDEENYAGWVLTRKGFDCLDRMRKL